MNGDDSSIRNAHATNHRDWIRHSNPDKSLVGVTIGDSKRTVKPDCARRKKLEKEYPRVRSASFQFQTTSTQKKQRRAAVLGVQATVDHRKSLVFTQHHATEESSCATVPATAQGHMHASPGEFCMSECNRSKRAVPISTSVDPVQSSHCTQTPQHRPRQCHNQFAASPDGQLEGSPSRDPPSCRLMPQFRVRSIPIDLFAEATTHVFSRSALTFSRNVFPQQRLLRKTPQRPTKSQPPVG